MKNWLGKIIGVAIGFYFGGPVGLALGVLLGNAFDKTQRRRAEDALGGGSKGVLQTVFFQATFSVMGKIAKADGNVSQKEIDLARQVMTRMALNETQRRDAMQLFNDGKAADFSVESILADLAGVIGRRASLAQIFLEIQLQTAYADGSLSVHERDLLQIISSHLGINRIQFEILHQRIRAQMHFSGGRRAKAPVNVKNLANAYQVLGLSAEVGDAELKKAYRRLMNQHHPDKMVAKGPTADMMSIAKEKTQDIQQAYEEIQKARKALKPRPA
ncbi:MAG: DnaJ like chaperone protein [Reinekea sp.]|jgi:DnaJ like chaperone protein